MESKNKNTFIFINYILSPAYVFIMFWIMFFEDNDSFINKLTAHKTDPKMYIAFLLSVLSLILLRKGMKFSKK